MAPVERGKCLYKLADLIEKNRDEIAQLESLDNGKPYSIANAVDVQFSINHYRYFAGWADKIHGETLPSNGPFFSYTKRDPVGVVG